MSEQIKAITIMVEGMHCGSCVKLIETVIGDIAGVESVKVNLDSKAVQIAFDETQAETEQFNEAIRSVGFTPLTDKD